MKSAIHKQNGFAPMLKNVFKRNIFILISAQIFTLLATVTITISEISINEISTKPTVAEDITFELSVFLSSILAIISFFIAIIVVYVLYRELFSKRASDFLLSLPVKRNAFFNANALFCLINTALSYVVSFVVSLLLIKSDLIYPAKYFKFDVAVFSKLLLLSFFTSIALSAMIIVCAVISGRKWHYLVLSYLSVSSFAGLSTGIYSYINTIWGFEFNNDYSFVVSPVVSVMTSADERLKKLPALIIVLMLQAAIAYIAGLIAFKHRKAEVAETRVSGKFIPFIIITAFLLANAITTLSSPNSLYVNIFAVLLLTLISVLIITALFYRKPFNKLTLASFAVSAVVSVVFVLCVSFIPKAAGYIDYVPEASEVESVNVEMGGDFRYHQYYGLVNEIFLNSFYSEFDESEKSSYNFSTDESKSAVSALHKKLISDETIYQYYNSNEEFDYDTVNKIHLEYKLKNGGTVYRTYYVKASSVYNEVAELFKTEEILNLIAPMSYKDDEILFVIVHKNYGDKYYKLDKYDALMNAVKKDMLNSSNRDFLNSIDLNGFDSDFYNEDEISEDFSYVPDSVFTFTIDKFSDSASKEQREKMSRMSPSEMIRYDNDYVIENEYTVDYLLEYTDIYVLESYENIIKYFESLEY